MLHISVNDSLISLALNGLYIIADTSNFFNLSDVPCLYPPAKRVPSPSNNPAKSISGSSNIF